MTNKHNMQVLQELAVKNGPLCVGLDTDPSYLPELVLNNFASPAEAIFAYNKEIIRQVAADKSACCFKIQIAYYAHTHSTIANTCLSPHSPPALSCRCMGCS